VEGSIPSNLKKSIVKAVATCLGSGLAPVAPGTFGTVFGLLVYVLLGYSAGLSLGDTDMGQLTIILVIAIIVATILGTWATMELEEEWGHDPTVCPVYLVGDRPSLRLIQVLRYPQATGHQEGRCRDGFLVFSDVG